MELSKDGNETKKEIKRKTLAQLFEEPQAIDVCTSQFHQAFMLVGVGTESSLNNKRPRNKEVIVRYHLGAQIVICFIKNKNRYYFTPAANLILGSDSYE